MDTRGAERGIAEMLLAAPYVGELEAERFHGFGRTALRGGEEYAGEFEHGRRHGSGTAVWPDGLKYIGEWRNNAASGHGCLSWPGGALYVGEVRRGMRHGVGVYRCGDCKYIGEWREGQRNGWGTQLTPQYTYTGEWVDGHRHGWGSVEFASLNRYAGQWEGDKISGRGAMLWVCLKQATDVSTASDLYRKSQRDLARMLRAQLQNVGTVSPGPLGPFTPAVAASTDTLEQYVGDWSDGKPHGRGEYRLMFRSTAAHRDVPFEAINEFNGSFKNGQRHGSGVQHFADGTTFAGTWANNLKHGSGTIHHPDGTQEHVVMHNDTPAESSSHPRGGHGVMASVRVDDLLADLGEEDAQKEIAALETVVTRASNTLHHLFNVYSSVVCPVDYEAVITEVEEAHPVPAPPDGRYLAKLNLPQGLTSVQRNAMACGAVCEKVTSSATAAARRAFDIMKRCESQFEVAASRSPSDFFSPSTTVTQLVTSDEASPQLDNTTNATPLRTSSSARRPATPQVDVGGGASLESLLPGAISVEPTASAAELRLTIMRFHALLGDAQLLDAHFPLARVREALDPLRMRLRARPMQERALSYPAFVEALVRIAEARIGNSYPFFTANALRRLSLSQRVDYLITEFLWPLCSALKDLDACTEFVKLGVDRFVHEASENSTVEEIRKAAVRVLRDKARISKMKERETESAADLAFTTTRLEMDTTMRLGDTVANLTQVVTTPDQSMVRRLDRPSSAAIDALDSMDMPCGATHERITAVVKHKAVVGAKDVHATFLSPRTSGVSSPLSPNIHHVTVPGAQTGGHLEAWFVLVNVRHAHAVHHRAHAVLVSVSAKDERKLAAVFPSAALHRLHLVCGVPLPIDVESYVRGAEPLRDGNAWAVRMPLPLAGHHLSRFGPVAAVFESRLQQVVRLHRHCRGRIWHLVDGLSQLGLIGPMAAYATRVAPDGASTAEAPTPALPSANRDDERIPADVFCRNLLLAVGTVVDSCSSCVTSVDACPVPPVYDPTMLRAFLKKTPELAAALQIAALQEDQRREIREAFRNLRTPVAPGEWWSLALELELSLEEFVSVLALASVLLYVSPPWPAASAATGDSDPSPSAEALAAVDAFETSSSMSAGTSLTRKSSAMPPATVSVVFGGLERGVQQFAQCWEELATLPRRADSLLPGACFATTDDETVIAAHTPSRSVTPSRSPRAGDATAAGSPMLGDISPGTLLADEKDKGKKQSKAKLAPPAPPPVPSTIACLHRKARLGSKLIPLGGIADVPPVNPSPKLPVRPRSVPVEDPKKKKGGRK